MVPLFYHSGSVLYLYLFSFVLLRCKVHVQGIDIPYERGMMKVMVYAYASNLASLQSLNKQTIFLQ